MTTASERCLQPEVVQRIGRLELRARYIVEGFMSGLHRSPYFGQSVEFLQHRQYVPGDDPRHVDWKVWAKQDRLYIKQYEEDTNLRCTLLVDTSASMAYGRGPLTKLDYACTVASAIAYIVLRQQDAVACATFDSRIRNRVPSRTSRSQLATIVAALQTESPQEKTDIAALLREVAETFPRRSVTMLISDLLGDPEQTLRGLRLLRQKGHDVFVLHLLDDDELDFPFAGPTRFEGLESAVHLNCTPRALRDGYLKALDKFLTELRRGCAAAAVDYTLLRTSDPLDAALTALFNRRKHQRFKN